MSRWRLLRTQVLERQAKLGWAKGTTPESWCCVDCGVNTSPGSEQPSRRLISQSSEASTSALVSDATEEQRVNPKTPRPRRRIAGAVLNESQKANRSTK